MSFASRTTRLSSWLTRPWIRGLRLALCQPRRLVLEVRAPGREGSCGPCGHDTREGTAPPCSCMGTSSASNAIATSRNQVVHLTSNLGNQGPKPQRNARHSKSHSSESSSRPMDSSQPTQPIVLLNSAPYTATIDPPVPGAIVKPSARPPYPSGIAFCSRLLRSA